MDADPNAPRRFTLAARLRSIGCALRGIRLMLRSHHNARLHLAATVGVVAVGALLHLSIFEWCWIIVAVVGVWTAEALNTALEFLCDVASPAFHPLVEKAKDVAAGGVLIAATGAAAIGGLVLLPKLWHAAGF